MLAERAAEGEVLQGSSMKNRTAEAVSLSAPEAAATWQRLGDLVILAKPRLNFLVVVTAIVGYYLGAASFDIVVLFHTAAGVGLVAAGAAALNQVYERDTDSLMRRTRTRPLPDARMRPGLAVAYGFALSIAGLTQLALGTNALAAALAGLTLAIYILAYTPLKRRTSLATLVGAIPGALPPVIGWVAAGNGLSIEAWVLFAIVFFWQMPHFLAIAWMYRTEFARARFPLLPVLEPDGASTARHILLYSLALVSVTTAPVLIGAAGWVYLAGAVVLGGVFLAFALDFARERSERAARRVFLGSLTYLPLLWVLLLWSAAA
jgi:heme o synthase